MTSFIRSVKFMRIYGEASCATGAQKAPPRLPARGSASTRRSSKNLPRDRRRPGREAAERVVDQLPGLRVVHRAELADRRVLVVQLEAVEAEDAGLDGEPAVGDPVVALDRVEHAVDDVSGQLVTQVGRLHGGGVVAQAVHREAVADERVVAVRERVGVRLPSAS